MIPASSHCCFSLNYSDHMRSNLWCVAPCSDDCAWCTRRTLLLLFRFVPCVFVPLWSPPSAALVFLLMNLCFNSHLCCADTRFAELGGREAHARTVCCCNPRPKSVPSNSLLSRSLCEVTLSLMLYSGDLQQS